MFCSKEYNLYGIKCNEYGNKRTGIQRVTGWSRKTVWIENPPLLSDWIAEALFYK